MSLTPEQVHEMVSVSEEGMRPTRDMRIRLLDHYAGPLYSQWQEGMGDRRDDGSYGDSKGFIEPLNTHFSLVNTMLPNLAVNNPRNMVTTDIPDLRPVAFMLGKDLDLLYQEIKYAETLRMCTMDALVGPGIMKVAMGPGRPVSPAVPDEPAGYLHDVGMVFADRVSPDDYGCDLSALSREGMYFEYDTYRIPRDFLEENADLYDQAALEEMNDNIRTTRDRASDIGNRNSTQQQRLFEIMNIVELRDVWLPKEGKIVTIATDKKLSGKFLREFDWEGPERGPYEMLGFAWVPDNVMPVPLLGIVDQLFVLLNKLAHKAGQSADRSKQLLLYDTVAEEDAKTIRNASDGDVIGVQGLTEKFKEINLGGTPDKLFQSMAWVQNQYSQIGGNVDLIGGAKASSETLGQDQILQANSQIKLGDSRATLASFASENAKKLAFYLWDDPNRKTMLEIPIPGTAHAEEVEFGVNQKEGQFGQYTFTIDVYSMMLDDPISKAARLAQYMTTYVLPLAALAQTQGLQVDVRKLTSSGARLMNLPEFEDILVPLDIPQELQDNPNLANNNVPSIQNSQGTTNISLGGASGQASAPEPVEQEPVAI